MPKIKKSNSESALVTFAKSPMEGQVKTRLNPPLTFQESSLAYQSFLLDTLENTLALGKKGIMRYLACDPSQKNKFFQNLSRKFSLNLTDQKGVDLGEKMENVFRELLHEPYKKVVIIGSDSPTLPVKYITQAFDLLDNVDLVIGPAYDGGYYLIGITNEIPLVFEAIPWGTDKVISTTLKRAAGMRINYQLLYPWYDIDDVEGLQYLYAQVSSRAGKGKATYNNCVAFFDHLQKNERINEVISFSL